MALFGSSCPIRVTLFESYSWPFRMLGRRKTKQPVCALLTFLMAWASGQSQPRLASTRHYGSLSMPTFRRQGPPVSKWNGTEKGLQTVAERLESSRGLSESRNLREIAREQSCSVKQRVKISCCAGRRVRSNAKNFDPPVSAAHLYPT